MSDLQSRIAAAMEKKRAELIHQPLARIWPELAHAAMCETGRSIGHDPQRCAECSCVNGDDDCKWIKPLPRT